MNDCDRGVAVITKAHEFTSQHVKGCEYKVDRAIGYGTVFDVARVLNMTPYSAHKAIVDAMAAELPNDEDWDESQPVQKGYKAVGRPRPRN